MKDLKVSFKSPVNQVTAAKNWEIVRKNLKKIATGLSRKTNNYDIEELKPVKEKSQEIYLSELSEEVSISEFSITPSHETTRRASKFALDRRRSIRLYDDYMQQYFKETKTARDLHRKLYLPLNDTISDRTKNKWNFFDLSRLKLIERADPVYPKYQPTYQLGPKIKFNSIIAENIIQDLLYTFLSIVNVNQIMSSISTIKSSIDHFCTQIKSRIKTIADNRYKLIVSCNIMQYNNQGIIVASKCLWDTENDVCVTVKEVHKNYVFIINLFAVYHE